MRSFLATILAFALGVVLLPIGDAHGAHTISRLTDGLSSGAKPSRLATGSDGNIWFTDKDVSRVGRITPGGTITEFSIGTAWQNKAKDIAAGPDGALWFTDPLADRIGRISTTGAVTAFSAGLPSNGDPEGITAGPDGNLWFTLKRDPGYIGRITPGGTITTFNAGLSPNKKPMAIAAGPDGNVWFTTERGVIGRITPAGVITEFTAGLPSSGHIHGITAGPDGNLWFTFEKNPGYIGRITPAGAVTLFSDGLTTDKKPYDIVAGPDGALWFTLKKKPGILGRITTSGVITEYPDGLSGFDQPAGIASGADGKIWFALSQWDGALVRVDDDLSGDPEPGAEAGSPATPGAPQITKVLVGPVKETGVTITSTVAPNGAATRVYVEYGPGDALTSSTNVTTVNGSATTANVRVVLSGLAPGNRYSYRVVAESDNAVVQTEKLGFTTAGTAVPGAPPFSPVIGKKVVVVPKSGTIRIRIPGTSRFVDLSKTAGQVPVGATIDARRGRVALTTSLRGGSKVQTATLWAGAFRVFQSRKGRGRTEFRLVGGHSSVCRTAPPRVRNSVGHAENAKPRSSARRRGRRAVQRRLWVRDRKGLFRTRGRNSVATVRGTKWLTVDRCDGTLTRVFEGSVVVRDLKRRKNVLVRAKRSYFAAATAPATAAKKASVTLKR